MPAGDLLREFSLDFLAMIVLREYILEVFESIYASSYEFTNKGSPPTDSESDEEDEPRDRYHRPRKRARSTRGRRKLRNAKNQGMAHVNDVADRATGVHKQFSPEEIPILLWDSVANEIGELPKNTGPGRTWSLLTKDRIFDFVFLLKYKKEATDITTKINVKDRKAQEWQRLRYLQAIEKIRFILGEKSDEFKEFIDRLRKLFKYFCQCIPNHSYERWLGRTKLGAGGSTFTWLCFGPDGKRIQVRGRKRAGSWLIDDRRIDKDWRWKLAGDGVLEVEPHKTNQRLRVLADGTRLYRGEEDTPIRKGTTVEVVILTKPT